MTTALAVRVPGAHLIQARLHQWHTNGDHPDDHAPYGGEGRVVRYFRHPSIPGDAQCAHCLEPMHRHGWIDQGPTGATVCPGDFILTTTSGQYMPIPAAALAALGKELFA
ncbi:hypothetical protein [Streptomyces longwoodensis]|uniref:hypothetical protein n=1 Tax=Streptomyces longwoodensis TaxID=68231 RepID=UPI0036F8F329